MGGGQQCRRRNDLQNRPSPLPSPAPSPVGDRPGTSLLLPPNDQEIYVYEDMGGLLVTDDIDGSTRPDEDACREFITNRRARPSDLPPLPLKDELIPTPQLLQALDKAQASANLFLTQPSDNAYHYWADGKRKYSSRSNGDEDHMGLLVEALLDKYNEENNLSGDDSYQVEKVVRFQEVYEGDSGWCYHLNCTRKTEGGVGNLFFAEVSKIIRGEIEEFELTCLHMLKSVDNGTCYGCTSDTIGMDHPIDVGKYKGGHDPSWPRGYGSHPLDFPDVDRDDPLAFPKDVDAWMKAEEERITCLFRDDDVAKSDAGRTPACSGMSQGRRLKYVIPSTMTMVKTMETTTMLRSEASGTTSTACG